MWNSTPNLQEWVTEEEGHPKEPPQGVCSLVWWLGPASWERAKHHFGEEVESRYNKQQP